MNDSWVNHVDYRDGILPPWEDNPLQGHHSKKDKILQDFAVNRLHHALLITGPKGIGKAHLAYSISGEILGRTQMGDSLLAHPNLFVLKRPLHEDGKKFLTSIPIKSIKTLTEKLHQSASMSGWRIVIIDAVDDLRNEAANALLKTLEEPPHKVLFLLVCHRPDQILPTIKSRCLTLSLTKLNEEQTNRVIEASFSSDEKSKQEHIENMMRLYSGQPGLILEGITFELDNILSLLDRAFSASLDGEIKVSLCQEIAVEMNKIGRIDSLKIISHYFWNALSHQAKKAASAYDIIKAERFARLCGVIERELDDVNTYNLDLFGGVVTAFENVKKANQ